MLEKRIREDVLMELIEIARPSKQAKKPPSSSCRKPESEFGDYSLWGEDVALEQLKYRDAMKDATKNPRKRGFEQAVAADYSTSHGKRR